jgi:hypothetical protein
MLLQELLEVVLHLANISVCMYCSMGGAAMQCGRIELRQGNLLPLR